MRAKELDRPHRVRDIRVQAVIALNLNRELRISEYSYCSEFDQKLRPDRGLVGQ